MRWISRAKLAPLRTRHRVLSILVDLDELIPPEPPPRAMTPDLSHKRRQRQRSDLRRVNPVRSTAKGPGSPTSAHTFTNSGKRP